MVVRLTGSIGMEEANYLREYLLQLIESGHHTLLVSAEGLNRINSSAIGVIVSVRMRLVELGGSFGMVKVSRNILEVFALTGLDHVVPVFADEEAAFRVFGQTH